MSSPMTESNTKYGSTKFDSFEYVINQLKMDNFWKSASALSEQIDEIVNPKPLEKKASFVLVHKLSNNEYELYHEYGKEASVINHTQLTELLSKESPELRKQKVANLEVNGTTILGNVFPRLGNVFLENEDTARLNEIEKQDFPPREGVFTINKIPVYINPSLNYLDGLPSDYKLIVGKGQWSLSKTIRNFRPLVAGSTTELSKEEFIRTKNLNHQAFTPKEGDVCVIYDNMNYGMTVPFKILAKFTDDKNLVTYKAMPLVGPSHPVNITFYGGTTAIKATSNDYIFPALYTTLCGIPERYNKRMIEELESKPTARLIRINIWDQGGFFSIDERNRKLGPFNKGEFIFTLINRYGLDEIQAENIHDKCKYERGCTFSVEEIMTEKSNRPEINMVPLIGMEKEAVDKIMKFAKRLSSIDLTKLASVEPSVLERGFTELDFIAHKYDERIGLVNHKEAAVNDADPNTTAGGTGSAMAENRAATAERQSGGLNGGRTIDSPQNNLISYLSSSTPTSKNIRDIIDYLLYLSVGKLRPEESVTLLNKINRSLRDTMNYLSKLSLLVKLERIPYINYTDVKTLLSDIDSFLSTLRTTTILMDTN
jgi:hypothetical protein